MKEGLALAVVLRHHGLDHAHKGVNLKDVSNHADLRNGEVVGEHADGDCDKHRLLEVYRRVTQLHIHGPKQQQTAVAEISKWGEVACFKVWGKEPNMQLEVTNRPHGVECEGHTSAERFLGLHQEGSEGWRNNIDWSQVMKEKLNQSNLAQQYYLHDGFSPGDDFVDTAGSSSLLQ